MVSSTIAWLLFLVLNVRHLVLGQVTLVPIQTSVPGLSATCITVIAQSVACNSSLLWAGQNGRYESDATLAGLCTTTCSSALTTWARRVAGACGTSRFETKYGYAWLPQAYAEQYIERYNSVCLVNSAGMFCNAVLRELAGVDPSNQAATGSLSPAYGCNGCFLSSLRTQLQMPLTSNARISSIFSAATKSCSSTNYSIPTVTSTTATTWSILANATSWSTTMFSAMPTATGCVGTTYSINSGDTCHSISTSQGIDTIGLLTSNNLQSKCNSFPTTGTLCIPTAAKCQVYTSKANDTCAKIADLYSLTWTQIVSWNPIVGMGCAKLSTYVGYQFCVSNPGGNWVNPNPLNVTSATVGRYSYSPQTITQVYASSGPLQTLTGSISDNTTIPYANGTRMDCVTYFTGYINSTTEGNVTTTTPVTCANIASGYGVQLSDLISWNPSLASESPCSFNVGEQYCVQYLPLNHTDTTSSCTRQYLAGPDDTCASIMSSYGLQIGQFYAWNPSVGASCETWENGYSYCVEVAHFRQPGIISTCNQFAMANETSWAALPCQIIETKFGLSHARFVAWNPAVLSNCTGINRFYDYCVSIPNYKPTYSTTTSYAAATWTASVPSGL